MANEEHLRQVKRGVAHWNDWRQNNPEVHPDLKGEQGGSIAMAVQSARYKHPNSAYSQGLKDLIDAMLRSDPKQRPDIHQVSNPLQSIA